MIAARAEGDTMSDPTPEEESRQRFRDWYDLESDLLVGIERAVIGSDYGANGYTTRAQADELARYLRVRAGDRLLDLGTGRGWPALYLAATYRCDVVASDVPIEGLRVGTRRARRDGLARQVPFVAARAEAPPFADASFDGIVHTDTLC
jgi:methylase of polypeptide subunit release factors